MVGTDDELGHDIRVVMREDWAFRRRFLIIGAGMRRYPAFCRK